MTVKTERQENCIVQLTISVDEGQEREYLRRSARAMSRNYRIRGFRPGKAPYNVVVQRLGLDMVRAQVIEQFGDQIFEEGLEESGLQPIDQAQLEDVTWDPLALHLKVSIGPETSLNDYRDIRIPWTAPEVTDEDLNEELLRLQKEQSEWRPDNRPAEIGDQVVLNIVSRVGDEVVLENTDRELVLNDESPYPVPGFAAAVVGMKPEGEREFDLAYPEEHYNAEIAGKEGHFEVRLNEIRVEVLPELDDEFAMIVGDYEDLEDLKTKARASLQEQTMTREEQAYEKQIWERLFDTVTIEYPLVMVDQEAERMKAQLNQQLQQQGMDLDSYFKLTNSTEEAWAEQARPQAEEQLKRNLLLAEMIKEEELAVEADEAEAEIERMAESMGNQADQFREVFSSPAGKTSITEGLLTRMAMERLMAIARGEDPPKGPPSQGEQEQAAIETEESEQVAEGEETETEPEVEKEQAGEASAQVEDESAEAAEGEAAVEAVQVVEAETGTPTEAESETEDKAVPEAPAQADDESAVPVKAETELAIDAASPDEDAATEAE